jgi:drug/metabolite transporter (DMT)-like permease
VSAAGFLDVLANAIFVVAAREGLLSLVSVVSSLYPASTVILARVVLHERVDRRQQVGLALALVGVVLIAI